jgi:20S proteasome alpha/beta subunit
LKTKEGVVLAVEKRITSPLLVGSFINQSIHPSIYPEMLQNSEK